MAKEVIIRMRDDRDNSVEEFEGDIETVRFSYGGKAMEIDLNTAHRKEFAELMEPYVVKGRNAPRKSPNTKGNKATAPQATNGTSPAAAVAAAHSVNRAGIRNWANGNGFSVGPYGKVPAHICEAYDRAHRAQAVTA